MYVIDNCEAMDLGRREGTINEIYHIDTDEERTNLEGVKAVIKAVGDDESLFDFVED